MIIGLIDSRHFGCPSGEVLFHAAYSTDLVPSEFLSSTYTKTICVDEWILSRDKGILLETDWSELSKCVATSYILNINTSLRKYRVQKH